MTSITHARLAVVKLGGRSLETPEGTMRLAGRLAALIATGTRLVIVHGGGAQVTAALAHAGIEATFVRGLRVTDARTLAVAEPVFAHIGKTLASALTHAGAAALGLTGRDAGLLAAKVKDEALGRVGTVTFVDHELLHHLVENGLTPVIGPIAMDDKGALNVNADEIASAVACAMGVEDLLMLTDVPGVKGHDGAVLERLTGGGARALIEDGIASGGMVPKLESALAALAAGVARVHVLDEAALDAVAKGSAAGTILVEG